MPLIKGKSSKAFEHNVKAEMDAGKPQNQSLAIAYSVKRKAKKKKMAEGGDIDSGKNRNDFEKGVHKASSYHDPEGGHSSLREAINHGRVESAKAGVKARINELKYTMPDPKIKKMAEGGMAYKNDSAKTESRPATSEKDNDSAMVSRNSAKKSPKDDSWTDQPTVKQAQKPSITRLSRPSMVPSSVINARLIDDENDLQSSSSPGPYGKQPPKSDDEESPDRQGPEVRDMSDEHSTSRKPYAKGGKIEASDEAKHPLSKYEDDLTDLTPSEDEGEMNADSHNEEGPDRQGPTTPSLTMKRMAEGGEAESQEERHASIAAAIMAKRAIADQLHSDSDIDEQMLMAEGGEIHSHDSIYSDDSSQADLSRNADEDANEEDQLSFNALRKENYSESEGLAQLTNPKDSGQHGDELEDEDSHDMVSSIRRKMSAKRSR